MGNADALKVGFATIELNGFSILIAHPKHVDVVEYVFRNALSL